MKERSALECISRILRDMEKRKNVDYADKNSVRRYNNAFDRMIQNANYLFDHYPEQTDLFMELVNHSDYWIAGHCTSILPQLHNCTKEQKLAAIRSAKRLLTHPDADDIAQMAWQVNIERWEAELSEDAK